MCEIVESPTSMPEASFYFHDFNPGLNWANTYEDVITFIESNEKLASKTTFVSTNYPYYLMSATVSPYDVDVYSYDFGNYVPGTTVNEELLMQYGTDANYVVTWRSADLAYAFYDQGFLEVSLNGYSLFYYPY